ncbi:MAG: type II secretion system GspH family protein [Akkermansiaceae bacterium]|jgi:prepilin-type N-terminal cleavage/methylation domain-containing protein|nr:type II secretion system GspH family protein [Akkermansiaceae bacterium]
MKNPIRNRRRGFTLIELMVSISIIVLLSGLVIGGYSYVQARQAKEKAKVQIGMLQLALEEYKADHGVYPPGFRAAGTTGTTALYNALFNGWVYNAAGTRVSGVTARVYLPALDPNNDPQGWIDQTSGIKILDPWGVEYRYRVNDNSRTPPRVFSANPDFDLWSCGPDGTSTAGASGAYDEAAPANKDDIRGW